MANYRVWAKRIIDAYIDVEADSPEEAYKIAEEADGGDFTETDEIGWEMDPDDVELNE